MALISDFYVASAAQAALYDKDRSVALDRVQYKALTYVECGELWAVLQNTEATPEHSEAFECILDVAEGQRLINRFPSDFTKLLAALDEASSVAAAAKWAQVGELAYLSCSTSDVAPIVESLARLARAAEAGGMSLYLWMCI